MSKMNQSNNKERQVLVFCSCRGGSVHRYNDIQRTTDIGYMYRLYAMNNLRGFSFLRLSIEFGLVFPQFWALLTEVRLLR